MNCPECGGETVVRKLIERATGYIVRRRKCLVCGYGFKTMEHPSRPAKAISVPVEPRINPT